MEIQTYNTLQQNGPGTFRTSFIVGVYAFLFYISARIVSVFMLFVLQNVLGNVVNEDGYYQVIMAVSWMLLLVFGWLGVKFGVKRAFSGKSALGNSSIKTWMVVLATEVGVLTFLMLAGFGLYVFLTVGASADIVSVFLKQFFSMYRVTVLSLVGFYVFQLAWIYKYLEPQKTEQFWISLVLAVGLIVLWLSYMENFVRALPL